MPRDDERAVAPARTLRNIPPLIWIGAAILAASLAGCIWLIVVAVRHADTDVAVGSATVFKVPRERAPAPPVTEGGAATPR